MRVTTALGLLLYVALMMLATQAILNPTDQTVKGFVLFLGLVFIIILKQEHMIYLTTFLLVFAYQLRYFHTISNAMICIMVVMLFMKSVIEKRTVLERSRIFKNSFFLPSLLILGSYLFSLIGPLSSGSKDFHFHLDFLKSFCCMIAYSYVLIAFVNNKKRLINMGIILLIMLIINLGFGLVTLIDPSLTIVPGYIQSGSMVGEQQEKEFRLGGLNFAWEAYAEYLMMVIVFITGFLMNFKMTVKYKVIGSVLLLLSLFELLLSNTRGAIVVTILGLCVLILFNNRYNVAKKVVFVFTLSIIIMSLLYTAHITGKLQLNERFSTFSETNVSKYGRIPEGRAMAWIPAIDKIIEDRFLGSGPSLYPFTTHYSNQPTDLIWPHNIILIVLATVGIYGLLAYLFLLVRFLSLYKGIRRIHDKFLKWFFYLLGLSLMMFIVDALKFDGFLRNANSYFYFIWLLISLFFCSQNFIEVKTYRHIEAIISDGMM